MTQRDVGETRASDYEVSFARGPVPRKRFMGDMIIPILQMKKPRLWKANLPKEASTHLWASDFPVCSMGWVKPV